MERDREYLHLYREYRNFNSHAHVERDDVDNYVRKLIDNFNSHAHVERDGLRLSFR